MYIENRRRLCPWFRKSFGDLLWHLDNGPFKADVGVEIMRPEDWGGGTFLALPKKQNDDSYQWEIFCCPITDPLLPKEWWKRVLVKVKHRVTEETMTVPLNECGECIVGPLVPIAEQCQFSLTLELQTLEAFLCEELEGAKITWRGEPYLHFSEGFQLEFSANTADALKEAITRYFACLGYEPKPKSWVELTFQEFATNTMIEVHVHCWPRQPDPDHYVVSVSWPKPIS